MRALVQRVGRAAVTVDGVAVQFGAPVPVPAGALVTVGPATAGILIGATFPALGSVTVAVLCGIALVLLLGLRPATLGPASEEHPKTHPLADLHEGFRYAMGSLPIRRMLFNLAAVSFSISPYATLMPAMAVQTFHEGAELVGVFIGAVGLGAVISAVSLARRPSVRGLGKWIAIAAIVAGLGSMGFGFSRNIWLSIPLMMMTGFGMFMTGATCNTILQTMVDEEKRSRVMSYYTMFFIGIAPFGHYLAGWLAEHVGVRVTFMLGGGMSLITGVIFALQMPTFRSHLREAYVQRGIIPASENTQMGNP